MLELLLDIVLFIPIELAYDVYFVFLFIVYCSGYIYEKLRSK